MFDKDEVEFLKYAVKRGYTRISREGNNNYVRIFREKVRKDRNGNIEIDQDGFPIETIFEQFCQTRKFIQLQKFKVYSIHELLHEGKE